MRQLIQYVFILLTLLPTISVALPPMNTHHGVISSGKEIYDLHIVIFYICCAIGFVVFGMLFFSIIRYRRVIQPQSTHFHEHSFIEILWTAIPALILIALVVPATNVLKNIHFQSRLLAIEQQQALTDDFDQGGGSHQLSSAGQKTPAGPTSDMTTVALMQLGEDKYNTACAMCHQPTGEGLGEAFPALKNSPVVTGPVDDNISVIVHGIDGTAMQAFGKQFDDRTLAAIVTYIRSAWGNDRINQRQQHEIIVQPEQVAKQR